MKRNEGKVNEKTCGVEEAVLHEISRVAALLLSLSTNMMKLLPYHRVVHDLSRVAG